MTTKRKEARDLTVEEYRKNYTQDALRQLLEFADRESHHHDVMREVPKIREALGQTTLTTAEVRENYAYMYARMRDPYPYQSDIDAGRSEFDAWLADHDAR